MANGMIHWHVVHRMSPPPKITPKTAIPWASARKHEVNKVAPNPCLRCYVIIRNVQYFNKNTQLPTS